MKSPAALFVFLAFALPSLHAQDELAPPRPEGAEPIAVNAEGMYMKHIAPIFEGKCAACHGDDKDKGDLRLHTPEWIMEGGKEGDTVIPGDVEFSNLTFRITLPEDADDVMPPEGKTPLSEEEIEVIKWWIASGASFEKSVEDLSPTEEIVKMLEDIGKPSAQELAEAALPVVDPAPAAAVAELREFGFLVNPLSQKTNLLRVEAHSIVGKIKNEDLAKLEPIAEQVAWLDLARTNITDEALLSLPAMPHLSRLHIGRTGFDGKAFRYLRRYPSLEIINFYGTKVGDRGLSQLRNLDNLKKVYAYDSAVSLNAALDLERRRPGVVVDLGWAYYEEKKLHKGLSSHFSFNGGLENAALPAASGMAVGGEAAFVDGPEGQALSLDGEKYVSAGNVANFGADAPFTIAAWVMLGGDGNSAIVAKADPESDFQGYGIGTREGKVAVYVLNAFWENGLKIISNEPLPKNTWTHLAASYDGSGNAGGLTLYRDGKPWAHTVEMDNLSGAVANDAPLTLGSSGGHYTSTGALDDVRVYDRVLTAQEVATLFDTYDSQRVAQLNSAAFTQKDHSETFQGLREVTIEYFPFNGDVEGASNGSSPKLTEGIAEFTEGKFGQALDHRPNFSVNYGSFGDLDKDQPFAVSAWVKPNKDSFQTIFSKMNDGNAFRGYDFGIDAGYRVHVHYIHKWQEDAVKVVTQGALKPNEWNHIVLSYDGGMKPESFQIAVNGQPQEFEVQAQGLANSIKTPQDFLLGRRVGGGYYEGALDELILFNRALTPTEQKLLHLMGDPNTLQLSRD